MRPSSAILVFAVLLLSATATAASFDFFAATPLGSWQLSETTTTQGGDTMIIATRSSFLGREERGGKDHCWIETATETFQLKKKGRKKKGDRTVIKMLVDCTLFSAEPENALKTIGSSAVEMIMQTGDAAPMKMTVGQGLLSGMAAMASGIRIDFEELGSEEVTVPAGTFATTKLAGTGSGTVDAMVTKIKVETTSTTWVSQKIPFGTVKQISDATVNGRTSHSQAELIDHGLSGAKSEITGEVVEMPSLGSLFGG